MFELIEEFRKDLMNIFNSIKDKLENNKDTKGEK